MSDKIKQKLKECHENLSVENDAHKKISELYDDAIKLAQASIGTANQTSSIDDRIQTLAEGMQSVLDLILNYRNSTQEKKNLLETKIKTIEEVLSLLEENFPTEKKS